MGKLETLRAELEKAREKLHAKGYEYNGKANGYNELMAAKPFEIAYQDVIEKIWPDNAWWQVTGYWDIFDAMMGGLSDEEVIDEICKHVGKDYLDEEVESNVKGAHVEKGHNMREYIEKFGDEYDEGELWDFSKEDFEDGTIDVNPYIVYWYMQDLNGEWRYFETNIEPKKECVKEEKKIDEGTSNFGGGPEHFPLLVFYTYDEYAYIIKNHPDYPQEEQFEDEDGNVDYGALEQAQYEFEEKAWEDEKVCVLDEDQQERLENKLYDFNEESKEMAWDADYSEEEGQMYGPNLNLEDVKVNIEPGYYSAAYIDVEHEDYLEDLDEDFKAKQFERFTKLFQELKSEFGLTELSAGPVASNGERGYSIVNNESLDEKYDNGFFILKKKDTGEFLCWGSRGNSWGTPFYYLDKKDDNAKIFHDDRDVENAFKPQKWFSSVNDNKFREEDKLKPEDFERIHYSATSTSESLDESAVDKKFSKKDGDEIDVFDTYAEAHKHLEDYAKKNNIKYYDIVEDNYEVPNGLLFIEYEDEKEEHEKSHYPLVAYKTKKNESESLEEKKSKKKYKIRYTGDPAKDAAFFNHAMGSDKGDVGVEKSSVSLGEGYVGQDVEDFLDVISDNEAIETLVISNIDADDYTEAFKGKYEDLDSSLLHCEYADFDVGGDILVVNVKTESDDWNDLYYDDLESLLEDYNGDEIRIIDVDTGETLFEGDKEDIDDEVKGLTFWSIDAPKYLCVNAHCGEIEDLEPDFGDDEDLKIEYWYDEESRDQGLGDMYFGEIEDVEDGKRIVRKMIDRDNFASAELQRGDTVLFGYDGESTWGELAESLDEARGKGFVCKYKDHSIIDAGDRYVITNEHGLNVGETKFGLPVAKGMIDDMVEKKDEKLSKKKIKEDKKEEVMAEDYDVYALHLKVIDSNTGKINKIERIFVGSKKECDAKKKQLEDASPEDANHNKNVYKVSKVK